MTSKQGYIGTGHDTDDHQISLGELSSKYRTDLRFGLTKAEAEARLSLHGKNVTKPAKSSYDSSRFLFPISFGMIFLLGTIMYCIIDIVLLNIYFDEIRQFELKILVILGFYVIFIGVCRIVQGKISFDVYPLKIKDESEVIRGGERMKIPTEDIVVGDLILMKYGDTIPADVRITEPQNFRVDNFMLSGVHDPQLLEEKTNKENFLESTNIAFFSAVVVDGIARGIVINTGKNTVLSTIMNTRESKEIFIYPITKKLIDCLGNSAAIATVLSFTFFWIYWAECMKKMDAVFVALIITLTVLPVNLFFMMVVSYKIQCRRLSSKNYGVITSIAALQKLAFIKTIFLTKPGVLTMKRVTVTNLWYDHKLVEVWGGTRIVLKDRTSTTFKELTRCAILCIMPNDTVHHVDMNNQSAECLIDTALFRFLSSVLGKKVEKFRELYPKMPQSSYIATGQRQMSVHKGNNGTFVVWIDDPEMIVQTCSFYLSYGKSMPISNAFLDEVDNVCVSLARDGNCIKCVVTKTLPSEVSDELPMKIPDTGYTFLGILAMSDVPRTNIYEAVTKCKRAGIKVVLMTNDHPITARTFAKNIGVISEGNKTMEEMVEEGDFNSQHAAAVVVDGKQLKNVSMRGVKLLMMKYSEIVFARASPIQKLMMVATCQQSNSLVAVVGDTRDTLVMKKADLSITIADDDPSHVKADIYLTDDTFSALATIIEEGRSVYENLKKCSAYTLSANVSLTLPIIMYILAGLPLPVSPTDFLFFELLFDLIPGVALIFERSDPVIMHRPPPDLLTDPLWPRQMVFYACCQIGILETFTLLFTYFGIFSDFGWPPHMILGLRNQWNSEHVTDLEDLLGRNWSYRMRMQHHMTTQAGFLFSYVVAQCVNVMICRSQTISSFKNLEQNWAIPFSILFNLCLMLFIIYLPEVNKLAGMRPLKPIIWLLPAPFCLIMFVYDEIKKYIVRNNPYGWLARETLY